MNEYKVIVEKVRDAEATMNRLAREGWQVVSTSVMSGESFTVNGTHMVITLTRKAAM